MAECGEADAGEKTEKVTIIMLASDGAEEAAVPKRQQKPDEMVAATVLKTMKLEANGEDRVMELIDVTEPAVSSELGPQVIEMIRKIGEAMYLLFSFQNGCFRELADKH